MGLFTQGPGVFFLFAAFVMLIIVSVGTPIWDPVAYLKADINGTRLRLGQWGACVGSTCTSSKLGYDATSVFNISGNSLGDEAAGYVIRGLTYALVLVPIAAGIALFAIIVSLTTHVVLDIIGSLIAFFAFLVSLVALICASVLFVTARHRINDAYSGSPASLAVAYWLLVASTISLFIASLTVCFGSARARRQKRASESAGAGAVPVMAERRHWWQRNRY